MARFEPLPPEVVEEVAPLVHQRYLDSQAARGALDPERAAHRPWEELPESVRARSRAQVQGYPELLSHVSLRIVPRSEADGPQLNRLPLQIVERLAEFEHDRWMCFEIKTNPDHDDLIDWSELDEPARDKDRAPFRELPELLELVGYVVVSS